MKNWQFFTSRLTTFVMRNSLALYDSRMHVNFVDFVRESQALLSLYTAFLSRSSV